LLAARNIDAVSSKGKEISSARSLILAGISGIILRMTVTTLREARSRLGELVSRAGRGETVIIKHRGKPAVRLTSIDITPADTSKLKLSAEEARKLNAWADKERAAGRTKVFESPAAYVAHLRAKRTAKAKSK